MYKTLICALFFTSCSIFSMNHQSGNNFLPSYSLIFPEINQQVSETTQQFTLDQGIQQVTNHSQEILYNQVQNSTPIRLQPVYYYHPLAIFNYLLLLNQAANPQPSAQSSSRELNKIQHNTEPTKSVEKKPAEIKEKVKNRGLKSPRFAF